MALKLPTPESFPAFPYDKPYSIQVDLMRHVYESIEEGKVTIVESPTGTGKTLSLLCASLTWLADNKNRARAGQIAASAADGDVDWVVAQTAERRRRELEAEELEYEERLAKARKAEALARKLAKARVVKKSRLTEHDENAELEDDAFLPEDDREDGEDANISPAVRALMEKLNKGKGTAWRDPNQEKEPTCTKIYYASRTHSQLTQLVSELRKLKLSSVPSSSQVPAVSSASPTSDVQTKKRVHDEHEDTEGAGVRSYTRTVPLGSRRQLCINDNLREKVGDLDEACRTLLGEKGKKRCKHLPTMEEEEQMMDFRDQILAAPKDIEELAEVGRIAETCPYFASRRAIPQAELVTLPYNLLLQKNAREALGIDLTNQVVIIDEAHNLISTLLSLSSAHLPLSTLSSALHQASAYWSRFRTRLSAAHALHIRRLVLFLGALRTFAEEWRQQAVKGGKAEREGEGEAGGGGERKEEGGATEVMTVDELCRRLGRKVEGINLLEVEAYLRNSKIARKIAGYADKTAAGPGGAPKTQPMHLSTPPLHIVESFLLSLTSSSDDGRIILTLTGDSGHESVTLKYQLLNPATHFREVVSEVRALVIAGGTMSPMSDFHSQLFHFLPNDRLASFACGHVIPQSNLLMLVLPKGPSGKTLEFKYSNQSDKGVVAELGQVVFNMAGIVPKGLVVFLPSYKFLAKVKAAWKGSGLLDRLGKKKKIFWESQEDPSVDNILLEYTKAVTDNKSGALLFAVIGAKLSEGLNFSDDLARAVIVVGLPYANLRSQELQARMKYVADVQGKAAGAGGGNGKDAGRALYENMCMNAVNQSIGRAIRHKADWALLMLIDVRYQSERINAKLPKWISKTTIVTNSFGQAVAAAGVFFRQNNSRMS